MGNELGYCRIVDVFLDCDGVNKDCLILKIENTFVYNNRLKDLLCDIKILAEVALEMPLENKNKYLNMILEKIEKVEDNINGQINESTN